MRGGVLIGPGMHLVGAWVRSASGVVGEGRVLIARASLTLRTLCKRVGRGVSRIIAHPIMLGGGMGGGMGMWWWYLG